MTRARSVRGEERKRRLVYARHPRYDVMTLSSELGASARSTLNAPCFRI